MDMGFEIARRERVDSRMVAADQLGLAELNCAATRSAVSGVASR